VIGSEAAKRAGMSYRAIDGTTGGVVVAAGAQPRDGRGCPSRSRHRKRVLAI